MDLCNVALMSDTLNSPQGDGNFLATDSQVHLPGVRHPQFPARGRKPKMITTMITLKRMSDTLNSPQGDGNCSALPVWALSQRRSDTLNSPQGDGNVMMEYPYTPSLTESDTLNSPQGDGNYMGIITEERKFIFQSDTLNSPQGDGNEGIAKELPLVIGCQTPSIPRKGTETP